MKSTTIALQPQWSRIIHRLHSLGKMRIEYSNRIANLSQLGYYPRYVPSSLEDKSRSIDGSVIWNFLNWEQGFVSHEGGELSLEFLSRGSHAFHKLSVVGDADAECLSCLLKLFGCEEMIEKKPEVDHAMKHQPSMARSLGFLLEKCVDKKHYQQGVGINLFTEGGVVSKHLHFNKIKCQNGVITLIAARGCTLSLVQRDVQEVKTIRTLAGMESTILNENGMPLITIKMPA